MNYRLLDTYCCGGGAAVGYHRASFEVVGVDIKPQPHYPFAFIQGDAIDVLTRMLSGEKFLASDGRWYGIDDFDAIHASPPCQAYSIASVIHRNNGKEYPKLIEKTRDLLESTGKFWIMENVVGAPLRDPITLCGLMFDLRVLRHRLFETSFYILRIEHPSHIGKRIGEGYFSVAGGAGRWKTWGKVMRNVSKGTATEWREAMGIDWMTRKELTQAVPPAYTEFIGRQLMEILNFEIARKRIEQAQMQLLLPLET